MKFTSRFGFGVLGIALLVLSGCVGGGHMVIPDAPQPSSSYDGAVPDFTGPWADQFAQTYRLSANEEQRDVLEDGVITAAEYEELRSDLVSCVANFGGTVTLEGGGGMSIDLGSRLTSYQLHNDVLPECERESTGWVAALYESIVRNPSNLDEPATVTTP